MKTLAPTIVSFFAALFLGWLIWGRSPTAAPAKAKVVTPVLSSTTSTPSPPVSNSQQEWRRQWALRQDALRQHPELAAEYNSLLMAMDEQQKNLETAMVTVDPKVAPIIAKLERIRKANTVPRPAYPGQ